ncbi:hypothetical protein [Ruegeria sp. HKCCD7255]|uniref:hypothetical protein n=1 Tax=Ruegeria sp. HKCCD7255 TaxID=2683004 RepID=UPI0014882757|nr:hypothetical protein [Ruegeria sp. HKCCD7255]
MLLKLGCWYNVSFWNKITLAVFSIIVLVLKIDARSVAARITQFQVFSRDDAADIAAGHALRCESCSIGQSKQPKTSAAE